MTAGITTKRLSGNTSQAMVTKAERAKALITQEVRQKMGIRSALGHEVQATIPFMDTRGEKPMPARAVFAVLVAPMRADPEDPVAHPRRAFEVGLGFLAINTEQQRQIVTVNGCASFRRMINAQ